MKKDKRISKRIALIFLLSVVLSMWAGLDICAQRIKYTYDSAGNRLTRQKEIVVQTRGALSDEEEPSVYEEELSETKVTIYPNPTRVCSKLISQELRSLRMLEYPSMILPESCCSSGRVYPNPMQLIYPNGLRECISCRLPTMARLAVGR